MLTQTIYNLKKDVFFTSTDDFISAEWLEQQLQLCAEIAQIAVFLKPGNHACAVVFASINPDTLQTYKINKAINSLNASLPEYARIQKWVFAKLPFLIKSHQLTCSGQLCREQIYHDYEVELSVIN